MNIIEKILANASGKKQVSPDEIIEATIHRINVSGEALQGVHLSREEIEPIKEKAMACLEQVKFTIDKNRHHML